MLLILTLNLHIRLILINLQLGNEENEADKGYITRAGITQQEAETARESMQSGSRG